VTPGYLTSAEVATTEVIAGNGLAAVFWTVCFGKPWIIMPSGQVRTLPRCIAPPMLNSAIPVIINFVFIRFLSVIIVLTPHFARNLPQTQAANDHKQTETDKNDGESGTGQPVEKMTDPFFTNRQ
jgi:hypothetical protein